MHIEVLKAPSSQEPILANLMELYSYELSALLDLDVGPDGRYGYDYLPLYWTETGRHPYLIWVEGKLGGFVLLQQGSTHVEKRETWEISEFFVMKKWRQKGVGTFAAHTLWRLHPGAWQIRVLSANVEGHQFWHEVVEGFTGSALHPTLKEIGAKTWLVYHFTSQHLKEQAESKDDATDERLRLHRDIDAAG